MEADAVARQYALVLKELKAEWYYEEPLFSTRAELLAQMDAARRALAAVAADALEGLDQRLPFWINVYNGAVIDQAIDRGVEKSIKEARGFFRRRVLEVAGISMSLDEIEHGLLRDNRRHPARLLPALTFRPQLKKWIAQPFDARIHFALNCGARSCPPIAVYTSEEIEVQLELAAATFINAEVGVDEQKRIIHANRILLWYRGDFGDIEEWVRRYRDGGLEGGGWKFQWREYDWSL